MFKHTVTALLLCALTSTSFALESLPSELEGKWAATSASGGDIRTGWVSMRFDEQKDGALKGVMNWKGGQTCEMRDQPLEGKWDGATLVVRATFTSPVAFANCAGPTEFVIKRKANGTYEGKTDRFANYTLNVYLSPKTR